MISGEERQEYSRKLHDEGRGSYRQGKSFDYPTRLDGDTAIITVHKIFQKKDLADRDYDVIVDIDIYKRLENEDRRIFIHPYIGGQWHRHDNVVRVMLQLNELGTDRAWALSWYVLGKRPEKGILADHINGDDLDNRKDNLRWATHEQNMQNRPGWNKYSSHPGISFKKATGKWGVCVHRSFESLEEAEEFSEAVHSLVFGRYARKLEGSAPVRK